MKKNLSIVPRMLKNDPRLALNVAKSFWTNFKAKYRDYKFNNGTSNSLSLVTFRITPLCNLRCKMCGQYGKTGIYHNLDLAKESKKLVPVERYMELTDELAKKKPILYIWGGEPFMYPGIMELGAYMAKKCPAFSVNTNGTYLAESAERIVKDKWAALFVSLDGPKNINDSIRGKGTFDKVIDGIKAINKEKKLRKSSRPYVGIVTAISNMNYLYLEEFANSLRGLSLAWHFINLGSYTSPKQGKKHTEFMKKYLDTDAFWWKGIANGCYKGIDGVRFSKILTKVQKINNGYPIITVPVIKAEKMNNYYSDMEMLVRNRCIAPWVYANIDYNGDVHFCADYPDYIIGNIKKDSFFNIYNNSRAKKMRNTLKQAENGVMPMCTRCYQLMLLGHRLK